jgi:putative Mg2+ transporter-C (MgtC) family protein
MMCSIPEGIKSSNKVTSVFGGFRLGRPGGPPVPEGRNDGGRLLIELAADWVKTACLPRRRPFVGVEFDEVLRLVVAIGIGITIGFDREIRGKPIGMRTLALVALGSAIAGTTATQYAGIASHPDALARVVQGTLQGVLTGIGFIGAGVVIRDRRSATVHGLTTAATVWVTAALGIACALAAWTVIVTGAILTLSVLFGLGWIERWLMLND